MNNDIYILAFLSRVYADLLDFDFINDLLANDEFLESIGTDAHDYLKNTDINQIISELNTEYTSLFLMNAQPLESAIVDNKDEVLVGLQNPVMQFYFESGYEINLLATDIQTPDHISIELAFLQNLAQRDEKERMKKFLDKHLLEWAVPYLISLQATTQNNFYKDIFDFTAEYLVSLTQRLDYED